MIGRCQHDQIVTTVILINTNDIKQVHGEGDQAGIIVLFFNTLSQCQRFFTAVRVDLEQTITTLLQLSFQRVMLFATGFDQIVKAIGIFWFSQVADQIVIDRVVDGTAGRAGVFERIQTFVVPAHQHRLRGFSRYGTWI